MNKQKFDKKVKKLFEEHNKLVKRKNVKLKGGNGVFDRYKYPVLTAEHAPVFWRYDLNHKTNPYLMERLGVNCAFNAGAMEFGPLTDAQVKEVQSIVGKYEIE